MDSFYKEQIDQLNNQIVNFKKEFKNNEQKSKVLISQVNEKDNLIKSLKEKVEYLSVKD